MSSDGQIIGAIVGAAVGVVMPGSAIVIAQGAFYGAAIGAALDPPPGPKLQGPQIADNAEQTSSYGAPVATINGMIATTGTVIWVENNKKKIVVTEEEAEGGKGGGGGATTETQTAFVTCAILLTDHLVDGAGKTWIGGELKVNAFATDAATAAASSELFPTISLHSDEGLLKASLLNNPAGGTIRIYPGYDDQMPDPRMEADLGAGRCPAYRGETVLFLYDYPLADVSNSIAGLQVKVELIKSGANAVPVLLSSETIAHPDPDSNISYWGNCAYLNDSEAVVYFPYNSGAPQMAYKVEVSLDSAITVGALEYSPVSRGYGQGWSDFDNGPYNQKPLSAWPLVPLDDTNGRFIFKNDKEYGRSVFTGKIYAEVYSATPASTAYAMAVDDSGNVYVVLSTGIAKYDEELNLVSTKAITFAESYANRDVEAVWDSSTGLMWLGFDAMTGFYAVDYEAEITSSRITLASPSAPEANPKFNVNGGVLTRFYYHHNPDYEATLERWRLPIVDDNGQPLADVVRTKLERCELIEAADINVTLLSGNVTGAKTSGLKSTRSALNPLMSAYHFDLPESGFQIKAVPRGQSSVMTIDPDDLDARPFGSAPGVKLDRQREMESQLARSISIDFIDAQRNYNRNQAFSIERISSKAVNKEAYELALVFTPEEATEIASAQLDRSWLERDDFSFKLPHTYNRLEPSDVISMTTDYAAFEFRISAITYLSDGRLEITAKLNDATIYIQNATGGSRVLGDTTIPFAGKSILHLLDIPLIRDQDDKPGFASSLTGKSSGWPGGTIVRSVDNGQTFTNIQSFTGGVTAGLCRDSLPAHDGYTIDRTNTLTVDLYNTGLTLSSITQAQMITNPGKNWFACGVEGRWELCQYANATLNADGSYTLDTLVRGAKGTEQYTDDHVDGDLFIFLSDADAAFIAAEISSIGVEVLYRGVTSRKPINDVADTLYTYTGANLMPPSVVNVQGSIDGSDNWNFTYVPRSRLSSSWWTNGIETVGEASENYEHDIMNGATVLRTITSTTPAFQYTSADQVTDWGANKTTGFTINIYKMSATVGRGHVTEVTL